MRTLALLLLCAACSKDDGGATTAPTAGSAAASGSAAKKGTGFSASLSAELAKEGSSAPSVPMAPAGSGSPAAGSAVGAPGAGSAASGSAAPAVAMAGSAAAKGSNAPATTPPATTPAATTPAATTPAASATTTTTTTTTKPAATTTPATTTAVAPTKPVARVPVKPSAELAAIKMDLEPNWERDIGEAGTISFVLNVPNSSETRVFSFHYGYDPAGAPDDRDAYMKWLADNKLLSVSLNRQRGAAWYLEGSDGNGAPAFRTLVSYGGKHLVCWGTLYKDAASNPLGDLRDKVVMTAKQICGTMTL